MNFYQLLSKTKKGEILTEKEVDILAKKLGLAESFPRLLLKGLLTAIIAVLTVIGLIYIEQIAIKIIIILVAIIIILFIFLFKRNTALIVKYLDTVKDFYIDRLCEFEGFESMLVQHQFMKNGYLQNNLAIFATDGYVFYIFDDLLKETKYLLPKKFKAPNNKRPALKVFDKEFVRKRPVCFEAKEISYYELLNPYTVNTKEEETYGYLYRRYTYTISDNVLDNYCMLVLNDGSTFKLAPEVVVLLRKKARRKERE